MAEAARIHPLGDRRFARYGVTMTPCPACDRVSLRAGPEALPAIASALGLELPTRPRLSAAAGAFSALWLGPDEWLLLAPSGSGIVDRLAALPAGDLSAVDISHRNTAFTLEGEHAETTLAAGCPRDLSLAGFPVGSCTRTVLAKAEIILLREAPDRFRVECWRSFSDYVWNYCMDSAKSL